MPRRKPKVRVAGKPRISRGEGGGGRAAPPRTKPKTRKQPPADQPSVPLQPADRRRALVMLGDGIGNIVQQTPLLVAVASWFEEVDVWLPRSGPASCLLLDGMLSNVRRVMHSKSRSELKSRKYDASFSTWLVKNFVKSAQTRRHFGSASPFCYKCSESEAAMRAVRAAGWDGETPRPMITKRRPSVALPRGTLVGVTTGSRLTEKWRAKRYPKESYERVFDLIVQECSDAHFIHVGIEADTELEHPRLVDLRGKLPLNESAGAISRCCAFVGNDTGLSHIAAALYVPTVVLFGPTHVAKNLPPHNARALSLGLACQPCQTKRWFRVPGQKEPCNRECLRDLLPETVAAAVLEELHG